MRIGKAARRSGMAAKTIRFYEEAGLIAPALRTGSGYREFSDDDVRRLQFIHRARDLGFSVSEVGQLLSLWSDRERASAHVKRLALGHVTRIEAKMAELRSMRDAILHLAERCHGDDRPECPILDELAGEADAECAELRHDDDYPERPILDDPGSRVAG